MTATWTALHRELGIEVRELTYSDFEAAVARAVTETADLDWKQQPPVPEKREDFASDVAAMANGRGGVICIGVRENRETSAAAELFPTDISDEARRNLASVVTALIRPRIAHFEIDAVPDSPESTTGILVVHVRSSSNAPHVIERRGEPWMRVPFRQGSATAYMDEQELSRAYLARSSASAGIAERHAEILEHATNRLAGNDQPWLYTAAVPLDTVPRELQEPLTPQQLAWVMSNAQLASTRVLPHSNYRSPLIARMQPVHHNVRRGPRGWMIKRGYVSEEPGLAGQGYIMLYDDGSLVLATQLGGARLDEDQSELSLDRVLSIFEVESLAADFFSVVDFHSQVLGDLGSMSVRAGAARRASTPLYLVTRDAYFDPGWFSRAPGSIGIERLRSLTMDYVPNVGEPNRRRAAEELARDIEEQFGVAEFAIFRDSDPAIAGSINDHDDESVETEA